MDDINFDCPRCAQNLDAPADMAGMALTCPACGEAIKVPQPPRVLRKPIVVALPPPGAPRAVSLTPPPVETPLAASGSDADPVLEQPPGVVEEPPVEQMEMFGIPVEMVAAGAEAGVPVEVGIGDDGEVAAGGDVVVGAVDAVDIDEVAGMVMEEEEDAGEVGGLPAASQKVPKRIVMSRNIVRRRPFQKS